jgi:multidrug efflux system outer membrane protein
MNVEQARSQYETAAAAIPGIESQIAQTENAISILLGRNPGPIERGRSILEITMPAVPSGVPSQVLERRPDILQAEQQLVAANAQIGAARALYFPTITLTGGYGTASSDLSNLFKGPARVWSYGGSITGPIFAGGAIYGQVLQAEAGQKEALLSYQAAIQSAFSDVENSLVVNQKFVEQLQAQERLVRANQEYSKLARLQYKGGYVPYSTVLQAEQQLFPSELSLAQTRAATFSSLVTIYQAMGGGWVLEADKLTASADTEDTEVQKTQGR